MDRATGAVAGELREIDDLGHGALTSKSGIAVKQDRQNAGAIGDGTVIAENALAGARFALDDRIDGLKVTWVGCETNAHLAAWDIAHAFVAKVIFHIAISRNEIGLIVGSELIKQRGEGFVDEISEHVETAAVGHTHLDLLHTRGQALFENGVEHDHGTFSAL